MILSKVCDVVLLYKLESLDRKGSSGLKFSIPTFKYEIVAFIPIHDKELKKEENLVTHKEY